MINTIHNKPRVAHVLRDEKLPAPHEQGFYYFRIDLHLTHMHS